MTISIFSFQWQRNSVGKALLRRSRYELKKPLIDKWTFSTNGIAIAGINNIPCIGLGPGNEIYAHAPNESCPI